ncbi:MAG: AAA family ATPase [Candidatus Eisenbacteria sp.]|nr:AAA family ATPase [Candidatus Eisenbacteria bacterium]
MGVLQKIKLCNFKRFQTLEARFSPDLNVLIGDNESGKSSILLAVDLTLGGSRTRVETLGLESLFNSAAIEAFLESDRRIEDLPLLSVELYLDEQNDPDLNGTNNSEGRACDGVQLVCSPNYLVSADIAAILADDSSAFPFEYYEVTFNTFSGKPYAAYNRPVRHVHIDSAHINNEYATREYIKDLYLAHVQGTEKSKHSNEYRRHKESFQADVLRELNDRVERYDFVLRTTGKATLESDLTIAEEGIAIQNKGRGQQCFIKTAFALNRSRSSAPIDILLMEEPENHLSHVNMKRLIGMIRERTEKQLVIATHNSLISTRLDLRKCLLLNSNNTAVALLDNLTEDTALFFMKAPSSNVLEFILSQRVILVEGDAEYILAEAFFKKITGHASEDSNTHIISVGGTSFKRYLELAVLLDIKTAVVRDNDGNYQQNCVEGFAEYTGANIQVFSESDNEKRTFEISLYAQNAPVCDALFAASRRTLTVQEYMLGNKAEAAFALLLHKADELEPPRYFADAIAWIRE